jgi:phospholipase C
MAFERLSSLSLDNFDDDPLKWFQYWNDLPDGPEKAKGLGFLGIKEFQERAANGTLPQVSYIVGAQGD